MDTGLELESAFPSGISQIRLPSLHWESSGIGSTPPYLQHCSRYYYSPPPPLSASHPWAQGGMSTTSPSSLLNVDVTRTDTKTATVQQRVAKESRARDWMAPKTPRNMLLLLLLLLLLLWVLDAEVPAAGDASPTSGCSAD